MSLEWLQDLAEQGSKHHHHHHNQPLPEYLVVFYIAISGVLVLLAGLMSGLTLGLLTMDRVDLEVLKRSGSDQERKHATRIMPVVKHEHLLLVTLVLCNAACNEALPLFLDQLVDPVTAVLLSVTVVLLFGEIVPQAVCSRYGLQVGAASVWFVRALMFVCAPVAWPIGKVLDLVLGGEHAALMRRGQLKELVGLHSVSSGGILSTDEVSIIQGALDLTSKTAWRAMTSLDKVFMLPEEQRLDEHTLQTLLASGHSRIPVYTDGDRHCIIGIILVKELILVDPDDGLTVSDLNIRSVPSLSAEMPLYDVLKLFEAGRSHMAVLTKPESQQKSAMRRSRSGMLFTRDKAYFIEHVHDAQEEPPADQLPSHDWSGVREGDAVGIITIEDVIEELLQQEIIDETDLYVDNDQSTRVNAAQLDRLLPLRLRQMVATNRITPRVGRLGHKHMHHMHHMQHMRHMQHMQHLSHQRAAAAASRANSTAAVQREHSDEGIVRPNWVQLQRQQHQQQQQQGPGKSSLRPALEQQQTEANGMHKSVSCPDLKKAAVVGQPEAADAAAAAAAGDCKALSRGLSLAVDDESAFEGWFANGTGTNGSAMGPGIAAASSTGGGTGIFDDGEQGLFGSPGYSEYALEVASSMGDAVSEYSTDVAGSPGSTGAVEAGGSVIARVRPHGGVSSSGYPASSRGSTAAAPSAMKPALVREGSKTARALGRRVSFDEQLEHPALPQRQQRGTHSATSTQAAPATAAADSNGLGPTEQGGAAQEHRSIYTDGT